MPRTKSSRTTQSKKAYSNEKRLPSLASLSAQVVRGYNEIANESPAIPSISSGPTSESSSCRTIGQTTKKNLRELFSAEETVVEKINLDGKKDKNDYVRRNENMEIFLRVRPFLVDELENLENKNCFSVLPQRTAIALNPPKSSNCYRRLANSCNGKVAYEFTRVLGDELSQKDVFEITMRKPIQQFLCGTSQLFFTYGVTNSGKTYTLLGPRHSPGILPRALNRIFAALDGNVGKDVKYMPYKFDDAVALESASAKELLQKREAFLCQRAPKYPKSNDEPAVPVIIQSDGQSLDSHGFFDFRPVSQLDEDVREDRDCVDPDATYYVWVSFLEIYEDNLYDLLDGGKAKNSRVLRSSSLKLAEEGNSCYAKGLTEIPVFSAADAYHIMGLGRKNLHVAATKLNEASSRSHSIYTLRIVKTRGHGNVAVSQLTFCDLAGSERANRTENLGDRLKESMNINKDLHYLKECIEALLRMNPTKRRKDPLPNYRNCKLTRLFRSFFSGRGKPSMIVNISQCESDFDETVQAIRFGSSVMQIIVPMTKRESLLIQAPTFDGNPIVPGNNVVSAHMMDELDILEESDEELSNDDDDENTAPTTVKKQPRPPTQDRTVVKAKAKPNPNRTRTIPRNAQSRTTEKLPIIKRKTKVDITPTSNYLTPSSGTPSSADTDFSDAQSNFSTSPVSYANERPLTTTPDESTHEEDQELNEMDLTLGGAISGHVVIPDEYWHQACPFPQHVDEDDQRVRALMLLLGELQSQLKTSKAENVRNEMQVRAELCDFYEKERKRKEKEYRADVERIEREAREDLERQLMYQKEALERQHKSREEYSLQSFESNELALENETLREEIAELNKRLVKLTTENGYDMDNEGETDSD